MATAQLLDGIPGEHGQSHLGAHAADRDQPKEEGALLGVAEREELQRVGAHEEVGDQADLLAEPAGESAQSTRRGQHLEAQAADLDDGALAVHEPELPVHRGDHGVDLVRDTPAATTMAHWCECVMATARASAAWSGRGMRGKPRMTLVISCTWILLARP